MAQYLFRSGFAVLMCVGLLLPAIALEKCCCAQDADSISGCCSVSVEEACGCGSSGSSSCCAENSASCEAVPCQCKPSADHPIQTNRVVDTPMTVVEFVCPTWLELPDSEHPASITLIAGFEIGNHRQSQLCVWLD